MRDLAQNKQIHITDRVTAYEFSNKYVRPIINHGNLRLEVLDDAVVTSSREVASNGIYDRQDDLYADFVDPAKIEREQVPPTRLLPERRSAAEKRSGKHVYLGTLHDHFGHFLVESLSRSWALSELASDTYAVFHARPRATWDLLPSYSRFMLSALGLTPDRLVFANKDMTFERLFVPTNLCVLRSSAHIRLPDVFDRIGDTCPESSIKKVYLTRTSLAEQNDRVRMKSVVNEREVETLFTANGYTVVSPEGLSIQDQISLFKGASHVAGTSGSALHMSIFCRPATSFLVVAWRASRTQMMLDAVRGIRSRHINAFGGWDHERRPIIDVGKVERYLLCE